MISVPEKYLIVKCIKNQKGEKHRNNTYRVTGKTYKIGTNKKYKLYHVCFDFELLEELCDSYINKNTNPEVATE